MGKSQSKLELFKLPTEENNLSIKQIKKSKQTQHFSESNAGLLIEQKNTAESTLNNDNNINNNNNKNINDKNKNMKNNFQVELKENEEDLKIPSRMIASHTLSANGDEDGLPATTLNPTKTGKFKHRSIYLKY